MQNETGKKRGRGCFGLVGCLGLLMCAAVGGTGGVLMPGPTPPVAQAAQVVQAATPTALNPAQARAGEVRAAVAGSEGEVISVRVIIDDGAETAMIEYDEVNHDPALRLAEVARLALRIGAAGVDVDRVSVVGTGPTAWGMATFEMDAVASYQAERIDWAAFARRAEVTTFGVAATPLHQMQMTPRATPTPIRPMQGGGGRPRNCATAVAMGMTAASAAQVPGLDRDRDGVACYGD